jgi:hypothetical protein
VRVVGEDVVRQLGGTADGVEREQILALGDLQLAGLWRLLGGVRVAGDSRVADVLVRPEIGDAIESLALLEQDVREGEFILEAVVGVNVLSGAPLSSRSNAVASFS